MKHWRLLLIVLLFVLPTLGLMGMGSYFLWTTEIAGVPAFLVIWWPIFLCLSGAVLLAWWWQRKNRLLPAPELAPQLHWTERDQRAWQLVTARAAAGDKIDSSRLLDVEFYFDTALDMAQELARHYHPKSTDPFGPLTIPEMLAVGQLAAEDLTEMVDNYLPGGHLLTIDNFRTASKLTDWYEYGSKAYWIASALYSPVSTAARFLASKTGMSKPLEMLGENLKVWFYRAFVNRVGHYLIELNSGRLRVGAKRYRELIRQHASSEDKTDTATGGRGDAAKENPAGVEVTITVIGQVKAGKSSLINALLGEQRAATDVLPLTSEISRYQLKLASQAHRDTLTLLDTVGYTHEGPKRDQLKATFEAVSASDLVLLVLNARDPARQPDLELMRRLQEHFREHPRQKQPPLLAVLTHIDLLSPALEWSPPYDYLQPQRGKDHSIAGAVAVAREHLTDAAADVIPVCTAEGRAFGVQEWLLPQIVTRLSEARAVALLRCLHAEADDDKVRRIFAQVYALGKRVYELSKQPNPNH